MRRLLSLSMVPLLLAPAALASPSHSARSPRTHRDFSAIGRLIRKAIDEHKIPGAVVVIGHNEHVAFRRAYGSRALEPAREPMTMDTIFDMASLTKPLITALAVMQLVQRGKIGVDEPVAKYLPGFAANGKGNITIRDLLTHYSGLPPDLPLNVPWDGKGGAYRMAFAIAPAGPPGVKFVYSDINYVVLGALVEHLSGLPLDVYAQRYIIQPLGLHHTRFVPPVSWKPLIAPTQWEHGDSASGIPGQPTGPGDIMLRGLVHDPTSRRMGGVAGHAGLFSCGDDLAIYAQNLLDRLAGRPSRFPLSRRVLAMMTRPEQPAGGKAERGFGWDIHSPYSGNRGHIFPVGSFGHTGFTGTSLWIDPKSDTYVIILTNAVHPNGPTGIMALRSGVADAAARALRLYGSGSRHPSAQQEDQGTSSSLPMPPVIRQQPAVFADEQQRRVPRLQRPREALSAALVAERHRRLIRLRSQHV